MSRASQIECVYTTIEISFVNTNRFCRQHTQICRQQNRLSQQRRQDNRTPTIRGQKQYTPLLAHLPREHELRGLSIPRPSRHTTAVQNNDKTTPYTNTSHIYYEYSNTNSPHPTNSSHPTPPPPPTPPLPRLPQPLPFQKAYGTMASLRETKKQRKRQFSEVS